MARAVRGSRAVESYLRNFEGEKARYQEILEITLCYGVQCLSRAFSLKGISCNELRTITEYDKARSRDFYVRNASQTASDGVMRRTPVGLRAKPSHSWRDGEKEMPDFPEPAAVAERGPRGSSESTADGAPSGALYSLPPQFDEIDYQTKLLGKQLVDVAWKTFAGREGTQITTMQELEEKFCRVDQRKAAKAIPTVELPVSSFGEFVGAYVADCVRQSKRIRDGDDVAASIAVSAENASGYAERSSLEARRDRSDSTGRGWNVNSSRAAMGNTHAPLRTTVEPKQRRLYPKPQQKQPPPTPRSIQHVRSKIQPELDARRQKILRVKKTQSQRMAETLARARLAEYDARRKLQDVRQRHLGSNKMPLNEITKGAAALEIVDDFMKSPLMDKFARDDPAASKQPAVDPGQQRRTQNDPLKEELYGTTALDDTFLGCRPAPEPQRRKSQPTRTKRNYNGWLGDFGPLHTKTVRPEWDEVKDDVEDTDQRIGDNAFEWNFEHLPDGRHEPVIRHTKPRRRFESEDFDGSSGKDIELADGISDTQSAKSDPVFRWLKDAV